MDRPHLPGGGGGGPGEQRCPGTVRNLLSPKGREETSEPAFLRLLMGRSNSGHHSESS